LSDDLSNITIKSFIQKYIVYKKKMFTYITKKGNKSVFHSTILHSPWRFCDGWELQMFLCLSSFFYPFIFPFICQDKTISYSSSI